LPTGGVVKEGEVFEATEICSPRGQDGMSFLRVGKRGWVFNHGIAGRWVGKAIVEQVPEEDTAAYEEVLHDPQKYAEYRSIMDDPQHLERIRSLMLKEASEIDPALVDPNTWEQALATWSELFGNTGVAKQPDTASTMDATRQAANAMTPAGEPAEGPNASRMYATMAEKIRDDPEVKAGLEALREARAQRGRKPWEPKTVVAPKWMKLAGETMTEREDEEGQPKRPKVIRDPPGGSRALRWRPGADGWRMGIRVPTVCSPQ